MTRVPMWRRYLRLLGPDPAADIDQELEFHLEMRIRELCETGWSESEARQEALRCFGDLGSIRNECLKIGRCRQRASQRAAMMAGLVLDLRLALRNLRREPLLATVLVISLALGIGANTSIFALVDRVLLATLPVERPHELVLFNWIAGEEAPGFRVSGWLRPSADGRDTSTSFSYPAFLDFSDDEGPLTGIFAFRELHRLALGLGQQPLLDSGMVVSGDYFSVLGLEAQVGRLLGSADDLPAAPPVAVLSARFWHRHCGGDPDVSGRTLTVNSQPFTIVGVAPDGFHGTLQVGSAPAVFLPLAHRTLVEPGEPRAEDPENWWLQIMGRLRPGVSVAAAEAALKPVFDHVVERDLAGSGESWAGVLTGSGGIDFALSFGGRGLEEARQSMIRPLAIAQVAVALILIIGCTNTATVLLARSECRRREMAVRMSLGAGRSRLIRQLLIESLVPAAAASVLGVVVGVLASRPLLVLVGGGRGGMLSLEVGVGPRVLAVAVGASLLTLFGFGLAPALRASGSRPAAALGSDRDNLSPGRAGQRLGAVLIVFQVALSVVLLVAAGLLLRTLDNLQAVDPGFDPEGLLTVRVSPTLTGYQDQELISLYEELLTRFGALPGVSSVTVSPFAPLSGAGSWEPARVDEGERFAVHVSTVAPGFVDTLRIPLLAGRTLSVGDSTGAPPVALVNQAFVRRAMPGSNPIGCRVKLGGGDGSETQIVGVLADTRVVSLRREPGPAIVVPYRQRPVEIEAMTFCLRISGRPELLTATVREVVAEVDSGLPIVAVKTVEQGIEASMDEERQLARLLSLAAVVSVVLACVGLYGTLWWAVSRRTREIAVRLALGASRRHVLAQVLVQLRLVVLGAGLGLGCAWLVCQGLERFLFALSPHDPMTVVLAPILLLLVASVAAYLPARHAARVQPVEALRFE